MKRLILFVAVGFIALASCAIREAPKGGPEDKTLPSLLSVEPSDGSTNLPSDAIFSITFSKPMQKIPTEGAIFLSPVFWGYPGFKWSGKILTIVPPENLKANTTYILTIGAGAIDIHNNKLGQSHSYAFSTGPAIDSGTISGAIFSTTGSKAVYDIWAYSLGDSNVNNFWERIPDYATQVDSVGGFKIEHLGANRYFVIAINDKNDDLFWDPSSEEIGLPPGPVKLSSDGKIGGIIFQPALRDTALCYITRANPLSSQRLAIDFSSQPKKDLELAHSSYQIKYGDSLLNIGPPYISEDALILETDRMVKGRNYQLLPMGLLNIWGAPFDTAGIRFTGVDTPDSTAPRLLTTYPVNNSTSAYEDSAIDLTFSKRLHVLTFPAAVNVIADSTDTLQFTPNWIEPNQVRLRFPLRIPREKKITVILIPQKITDVFQNPMKDSSLSVSFRLPPEDTVGSITASLEQGQSGNIIGILAQKAGEGNTYKGHFDRQGGLVIKNIMPGIYGFEYFDDSDSNGEWSPGVIQPFRPAERFEFLADTVKVRSRWNTDIGAVSLPNQSQ